MFTMKTYLEPMDIELMERAASCLRDRLLIKLLFRLANPLKVDCALFLG